MTVRSFASRSGSDSKATGFRLATILVLWVGGSLAAASLIAPAVYSGLLVALGEAPWPLSRVFNRVALLVGVLSLWALNSRLDFPAVARAWRRESWRGRTLRTLLGLGLALGLALAVVPFIVAGGEVRWSPTPNHLLALRVLKGIPGALAASVLEEAFFRVLVFGGLALRWSPVWAAMVSSAFYAWVHFLTPRYDFVYPGWSPAVGFEYLGLMLEAFANAPVIRGAAGLMLIGLVLCMVYHRFGSLALCVGLHSGWFVAGKAGVHLLQLAPEATVAAVAGKRLYLIGHPWTWMAVATAALILALVRRSTLRPAGPP